MSTKEFLKSVLFNKPTKKPSENQKLLLDLYKIPTKNKGKEIRHFIKPLKEGEQQQADILFLPDDNGYKYCLVVVDIANNRTDAFALKTKSTTEVLNAFKRIYSNKILKKPLYLNTDSGSEFKSVVHDYFSENNIIHTVSDTGRHSANAFVEYINKLIGRAIFSIQNVKELETKRTNRQWTRHLKEVIEILNEKANENQKKHTIEQLEIAKREKKDEEKAIVGSSAIDQHIDEFLNKIEKGKPINELKTDIPLIDKSTKHGILEIGTTVRYKLDYPIDIATGEKLHGKFRAGDIRWSLTKHKIEKQIIVPNQPISYLISGFQHRSFLYNDLQVV